ncbi:PilT/PilU family type 4a pilus ATPase [Clostridiaceae bacterium DONG20-135]|uniref:PilT/PilU family type 4a pilus ATPase n=1 Tax=Copranaerobaculum intestinale TaxID=2692629 RepID=A0A6N8U940_9FIRM|nr:type IV pilus twitching motility protein PilT [Copranaerobaculum intestinale]MXQ74432.1 PilT/PilU family type 4a pilus ATPase [Copranaerobaculum intestinale]
MKDLEGLLQYARMTNCSDLHISENHNPVFRRNGRLEFETESYEKNDNRTMILRMMNENQKAGLKAGDDQDFVYIDKENNRYRVNVYNQQNQYAAAIRVIYEEIASLDRLGLPNVLKTLCDQPRGLVLLSGPTGSGKSTTLAAMIDYINEHFDRHIITIEDPVEYVYHQKLSMIHQREVGSDVKSFSTALRSAMREDPDVILVGEMRDYETIQAAITAAETGHLVFSTLHTVGAAKTIDRIIDVFPEHKQSQIRTQLSTVLRAAITQQLIPTIDGMGRVAACEILLGTDAVSSLIRDNKAHQLGSIMQTNAKEGMITLNAALAQLVRAGKISAVSAAQFSSDPIELRQYL